MTNHNKLRQVALRMMRERSERNVAMMRELAAALVANRKAVWQTEVILPPAQVHVNVPVEAPSVVVEAPKVSLPAITVENRIEPPSVTVPVQINIPEITIPAPIVNLHEREHQLQQPPINVQVVVPPEAIRVEVVMPNVPIPEPKEPPKRATIKHEDGTTSTVELEN